MLVPTMGALHAGHLQLVRVAKRIPGALVVVSIFVNPLQFAEGEDLDAYPRTLNADVELLRGEGADVVFAPSAREMYPNEFRTTVQAGALGTVLEGAFRPTHFTGVLTVVNKLFNRRYLRREGLPTAHSYPADGDRPEYGHSHSWSAHCA